MENELRIGNLIKRNGIVVTVDHQTFYDVIRYPEQYERIPLTKEWLDKLSFVYSYFEGYSYSINLIEYHYSIDYNIPNGLFSTNIKIAYKLEYVHQIQNLYFSIKGKELTTK